MVDVLAAAVVEAAEAKIATRAIDVEKVVTGHVTALNRLTGAPGTPDGTAEM